MDYTLKKAFKTMIPFMFIAAIVEEMFFRGLIISLILPLGVAYSVLISAGAHTLVHFINPNFRMIEKILDKTLAASGVDFFQFLNGNSIRLHWLFGFNHFGTHNFWNWVWLDNIPLTNARIICQLISVPKKQDLNIV